MSTGKLALAEVPNFFWNFVYPYITNIFIVIFLCDRYVLALPIKVDRPYLNVYVL